MSAAANSSSGANAASDVARLEQPTDTQVRGALHPSIVVASEALAGSSDLNEIPTPFLAIDLDAMDRNIEKMSSFFAPRQSGLRPHVKSHKCTAIAQLQLRAGAHGITCSTTDEVAAMAGAGVDDLLLANVVMDRTRLDRLVQVAKDAQVTVAIDSVESLGALSSAAGRGATVVGVVIDCDLGMGRNGVETVSEGVAIAEHVLNNSQLTLRGVMGYEGHLIDIPDRSIRSMAALEAFEVALALREELLRLDSSALMCTGGSSATYDSVGVVPGMTDVQAGTYVLMDNTYMGLLAEFEPAAYIISTVITSKPSGRIVVDVGSKRSASDWGVPAVVGLEAEHLYTSEEHAVFRFGDGPRPRVGQRVAVLPAHICSTMSMYRRVPACRAGVLETTFEIDARDPLA